MYVVISVDIVIMSRPSESAAAPSSVGQQAITGPFSNDEVAGLYLYQNK
jgi:hypothetical protein